MTLKERFEKFSTKEKHELAYQIGMNIIKRKIEAEEKAGQMAKEFKKLTGHKPDKRTIKQVKEILSL